MYNKSQSYLKTIRVSNFITDGHSSSKLNIIATKRKQLIFSKKFVIVKISKINLIFKIYL